MEPLYDMIKKRKSVRKYDASLTVSAGEMELIKEHFTKIAPLEKGIRVAYRIVPRAQTTAKFGADCLLLYSEEKEHALLNAGYLLEQMDLFLASLDIGACWYGMAKPDQKECDGLPYQIMLAFGKSRPNDFRQDLAQAKRKPLAEIWQGDFDETVKDLARYAPSACNSQPWRVKSEKDSFIAVERTLAYPSVMPLSKRNFFNKIDSGIFLCFLEQILEHRGFSFTRRLAANSGEDDKKHIPVATYEITAPR
jgi:nitroreductase